MVVFVSVLALGVGLWIALSPEPGAQAGFLASRLSTLTTIFLGIFIEAAPYLLLGTLASGIVEIFFSPEEIIRFSPRQPGLAAGLGSLLGLFFPVCECGVIPLTRRLLAKRMPAVMGLTFLLAAPVLNPIAIASTYSAFGSGPVFWGRLAATAFIAILTGLSFSRYPAVLSPVVRPFPAPVVGESPGGSPRSKWVRVALHAGDEFFEMGRYLVLGASLAALMQTFLPRQALLSLTQGPVVPVLVLMLLAVLLSVCSTVDAFIALAFTGIFPPGAILAFLVFGPMVDIKSAWMYLRAFSPWVVLRLLLFPLVLSIIIGVLVNLLLT